MEKLLLPVNEEKRELLALLLSKEADLQKKKTNFLKNDHIELYENDPRKLICYVLERNVEGAEIDAKIELINEIINSILTIGK